MKTKKRDKKEGNKYFHLFENMTNESVKLLIVDLSEKFFVKSDEIIGLFNKRLVSKKNYELLIPISVFDNKELSSLETIVKYLKEELNLRFKEIALALNRNSRTIWSAYRSSEKKRGAKFPYLDSEYVIPVSIFRSRLLGILEAIVMFLKDEKNLRFHEIALLLNRNDRTVWTCYSRAKKKIK